MDPSLPPPKTGPTQPSIRQVPEGPGPRSASMPAPPSGSGKVQNHPSPYDASPGGNSLGSFPKTAAAKAAQAADCRKAGGC